MSIMEVAKFVKAFPNVKMCRGNHDAIPVRQAATVGIGERYLKSFSELLKLPKNMGYPRRIYIEKCVI